MSIDKSLWIADRNGNKCYIGDTIKDEYGFIGKIIKVPSSTDAGFGINVKYGFGEVPLFCLCSSKIEKMKENN